VTTAAFNRMAGPVARALNAVKSAHCQPPSYKPHQNMAGTTPCTMKACGGTIRYTVRASDGGSAGRCSSSGCLEWRE
jgi:hypothetical protein